MTEWAEKFRESVGGFWADLSFGDPVENLITFVEIEAGNIDRAVEEIEDLYEDGDGDLQKMCNALAHQLEDTLKRITESVREIPDSIEIAVLALHFIDISYNAGGNILDYFKPDIAYGLDTMATLLRLKDLQWLMVTEIGPMLPAMDCEEFRMLLDDLKLSDDMMRELKRNLGYLEAEPGSMQLAV